MAISVTFCITLAASLAARSGPTQMATFQGIFLWRCYNLIILLDKKAKLTFRPKPKSCSRAMTVVGVVEASCEEIFELVMSMDATRFDILASVQATIVAYLRAAMRAEVDFRVLSARSSHESDVWFNPQPAPSNCAFSPDNQL